MLEFRLLRADEIECRISSVGSCWVQLLLYKDARCDQNILDESVGCMNWMRHHSRDNANCIVSIWDEGKNQWIEKEDTGTESNTEKEKGLASDSFKRACFNWGIGRELYTAPQMFVSNRDLKTLEQNNGKWTCKDFFKVTDIRYENRKIVYVQVQNTKTGKLLDFGEDKPNRPETAEIVIDKKFLDQHKNDRISKREIIRLKAACEMNGNGRLSLENAVKACGRKAPEEITYTQYMALMAQLGAAA